MTVSAALVVVLFIGVLVAYMHGDRKAEREMRARFADRERLEWGELRKLFCVGYDIDDSLVREILGHVSSELSVEPYVLRPSDRFAQELRPPKGWEFDAGATTLLLDLSGLAKERGVGVDLESILTLNDYLLAMAKVYGINRSM